MPIDLVPTTTQDPQVAPTFAALQQSLGTIPNLARVLAHSSASLSGWAGLNQSLQKGILSAQQREQIALAVAEANQCHYCLAAHTLLGAGAGLSSDDILRARLGVAHDHETNAIISLALAVNHKRGRLAEDDRQAAAQAGLTEAQVIEITANVVLNIFTNYINHVAETPIDFPQAEALPAA